LGVEAIVSTPIDSMQWQSLSVELTGEIDSRSLMSWDHRTADPPDLAAAAHSGRCAANLPAGEGPEDFGRLAALNAESQFAASDELRSGKPYRLLVQLFPDGRCGVAVNGKPVLLVAGPPIRSASYRVLIFGRSVATQIAVGQVAVWSGVRTDVDWKSIWRQATPK
jgi:hypothetical protein